MGPHQADSGLWAPTCRPRR